MESEMLNDAADETLTIRPAAIEDLEEITTIYNYFIKNSMYTMDVEEKTVTDMEKWLESHNGRYPAFVGIVDKRIIGIASLSKWAERKGFYPSCEASIYLIPDSIAQGHGDSHLKHLLQCAKDNDFRTVISFMTSINKLARNLVLKNNFEYIGKMKEVGFKNNQFIDLDIYQYFIRD